MGQEVLADDLPDALDLLARWAPLVQASAVTTVIEDCAAPYGLIDKLLRRIETGKWARDAARATGTATHD